MKIIFPWEWKVPNTFTDTGIDLILLTGSELHDLNDPSTKPAILYPPYYNDKQAICAIFYIEYDNKIFEMLTNFNPRQMFINNSNTLNQIRLMELERIIPTNVEDAHLLKQIQETDKIRHRLHTLSTQPLTIGV